MVNLFDFDEGDLETRAVVTDLHQRFSVILRIINCTSEVKLANFRQLCIDTNMIMCTYEKIKWMAPNNTVHKWMGHAWENIYRNGCRGLGQLSEGALEHAHQTVKFSHQHLSNKSDCHGMLTDVYTRAYFTSAPSVRQYEPKKRKFNITEAPTYSDDDEMVQSYLVAEDEDYVQDLDFLNDFVPNLQ